MSVGSSATDAALVAHFRERGFVVVPDLLSADEVRAFGAAVDAAVGERTADDPRALAEKNRYEQSFEQCMNLWEDFEAVRPLTFHARLGRTAAELLGVPAVRVWHDQALYKQAGGKSTAAHQDQAYWPIAESDTITAWIPFQDVTPRNGGMGYVPGSHRFGIRKFANIFTGDGFDLESGPEARGVPAEYPQIPAGSVAFHHGLTLHAACANPTPAPRRVHTVIYFADGSHRSDVPFPHPAVDRAQIGPGELIRSDVTPIAWPRAGAALPSPPPLPDPPRRGWPRARSSRAAP